MNKKHITRNVIFTLVLLYSALTIWDNIISLRVISYITLVGLTIYLWGEKK